MDTALHNVHEVHDLKTETYSSQRCRFLYHSQNHRLSCFLEGEKKGPATNNSKKTYCHAIFLAFSLACELRIPGEGAVSHIIPSMPKTFSRHFVIIESLYPLSDICNPCSSKQSIVFTFQKPFHSQPNYSTWRLGIFGFYFGR